MQGTALLPVAPPPVAVFSHRRQLRAWRGSGSMGWLVYELSCIRTTTGSRLHPPFPLLPAPQQRGPNARAGVQLDTARLITSDMPKWPEWPRDFIPMWTTKTKLLSTSCSRRIMVVVFVPHLHNAAHSCTSAPQLIASACYIRTGVCVGIKKVVVMVRSRITHVGPQAPLSLQDRHVRRPYSLYPT